ALAGFFFISGLWMRAVEGLRTAESRALTAQFERLTQEPSIKLTAGAVVAGDWNLISMASVIDNLRPLDGSWLRYSAFLNDQDWDLRAALNGYLLGQDRSAFEGAQRQLFKVM